MPSTVPAAPSRESSPLARFSSSGATSHPSTIVPPDEIAPLGSCTGPEGEPNITTARSPPAVLTRAIQ